MSGGCAEIAEKKKAVVPEHRSGVSEEVVYENPPALRLCGYLSFATFHNGDMLKLCAT